MPRLEVTYDSQNAFYRDCVFRVLPGRTRIVARRSVAVGTMFLLALRAPGGDEEIELVGQVTASDPRPVTDDEQPGGFDVTVRFLFPDLAAWRRVRERVAGMLSESTGRPVNMTLMGYGAPSADAFAP